VAAVRERLALPERYLFFAGLLSTRKNGVRLIQAFELIASSQPGLHFVMAGGASHGFADILAAHERSPVRDRIHRLGFVSAADLPALYSNAEALVFATLYEGFGLPILEAHACGCPVVASDQGTPREVGGDLAFYVEPTDVHSIAAGIERALASRLEPSLSARRRAAASHFTWDRTAKRMLTIYEGGMAVPDSADQQAH
jgi:glycosyltransferase involved in cell wall biosynthesis